MGLWGTIVTSVDGKNWTQATSSGTSATLKSVVYGKDQYVAVGTSGTIVTSVDGKNWTFVTDVTPVSHQARKNDLYAVTPIV